MQLGRAGASAEVLGAGAAGCVYAGTFEGQRVAVKVAHPSGADVAAFTR